jgi:fructuronate reductase
VTAPLSAATAPGPRPERITAVHLGLGAFHRAHQLWATEAANRRRLAEGAAAVDLDGYASFTGRRPGAAESLQAQDGLFHLLVRHQDQDNAELIRCLLDPHDGADVAKLLDLAADPDVGVITLTITEAGYRRRADGSLDTSDKGVAADISALRNGDECAVTTAPGRLLAAIRARAAVGLHPLALVSCDNLIDNGSTLATVVTDLADAVGEDNTDLVKATSFVHTMVDRITPHTTDVERADISKLTGLDDADPVACEPFTEWILAGQFPSGRPAWELGGARFADDVKPFEQRKLWMLNATHSLLAYVGGLRGHETVDQAMGDDVCTALVTSWWDDARTQIDLPSDETDAYARDLVERYSNTAVQHRLAQIAGDGSQKLPIRIAPVLLATRAAGGRCTAGVTTLAAYLLHLRGSGVPVNDVSAEALQEAAAGDLTEAAGRVLGLLDQRLTEGDLVADVAASAIGLESST